MYLFFDTETTGIPRDYKAPVTNLANWPRVVQMAFLLTDAAGAELAAKEVIIRPDGFVIGREAAAIHGITTERALAEGVPLAGLLAEFLAALKTAKALVAHNMAFDEKIVGAELLRAKMGNPLPAMRRICTMEAGTAFCAIPGPRGFKWPRLKELHLKLFGRDFESAHSALGDVRACAGCFFELKAKGIIAG